MTTIPEDFSAELDRRTPDRYDGRFIADVNGGALRQVAVRSASREGEFALYGVEAGLIALVTRLRLQHGDSSSTQQRLRFAGQDFVEFHYRLAGAATLTDGDVAHRADESTLLTCYLPPSCTPLREHIESGSGARDISVSLFCSREWLRSTCGGDDKPLPTLIEDIVQGTTAQSIYRLLPQPPGVVGMLASLGTNSYCGGAPLLRARADALHLCSASLESLNSPAHDSDPCKLRFTQRDMARVVSARKILEAEYRQPPSLADLARRTGVNVTKLTSGFKWSYGETIGQFIRRTRLERAHHLLNTTDLQIGQIANRVGYGHHSTFTTAFTSHFAVKPRALLNARAKQRTIVYTGATAAVNENARRS